MRKRRRDWDREARPRSYWLQSAEKYLESRPKGTVRRSLLAGARGAGEDPAWLSQASLSGPERAAWGGIDPAMMGGEYLPDLDPNEVEIARIEMGSTTADVISLRAKRTRSGSIQHDSPCVRVRPGFPSRSARSPTFSTVRKGTIASRSTSRSSGGCSTSTRRWVRETRARWKASSGCPPPSTPTWSRTSNGGSGSGSPGSCGSRGQRNGRRNDGADGWSRTGDLTDCEGRRPRGAG